MKIGLDISPLVITPYTGVQKVIYSLTQSLIENHLDDDFVLIAVVPRASMPVLQSLPFANRSNVDKKFIAVPARSHRYLTQIWPKLNFPWVEKITGSLDIFHSFDWFSLPSKAPKTGFVFDLTPELFPQWHSPENTKIHHNYMSSLQKTASHLFALSRQTKQDIIQHLEFNSNKITVVYPDAESHFKPRDKAEIKKKLANLNLPAKYFLFIGSIEPRKNLPLLLESYQTLSKSLAAIPDLVLVGSKGWEDSKLYRTIKQNPKIHHLGYISDDLLPYLYNDAFFFVYPSLYEGFGLPVLEAMRSGCPVITSNSSSLPEVAADAAIMINPKNKDSLISALKTGLTLSAEKRSALISRGFQQSKKFSYNQSAEIIMQQWKQM